MNAQERFWREMYQLKVHTCYLELYLATTEHIDRWVNFAIAITSTGSLGMWAILKEYDKLWAGIIVLSQLVAVAKSFLPYRLRVKALASCVHEYEEHMVWAEGKWFEVAEGERTEQEITSLRTQLQMRTLKSMKECFPASTLPEDLGLLAKAASNANAYFSTFYGSGTNDSANTPSNSTATTTTA